MKEATTLNSNSMPKSVRIGPQVFKIETRDPSNDGMLNDGTLGYTLDAGNLIVVSSSISISKQQVTLMHEILHAMRMIFENGMPKKDANFEKWEHFFIGVYENSILMLLRDNDDLMEWLKK
jgi:Zn-dependent peptidase ImmA (M78 family)